MFDCTIIISLYPSLITFWPNIWFYKTNWYWGHEIKLFKKSIKDVLWYTWMSLQSFIVTCKIVVNYQATQFPRISSNRIL